MISCGRPLQNQSKKEDIDNIQDREIRISGIVYEASTLLVMPGVNVMVKGSKIAAQTDIDGKYSLDVKKNEIVIFSFTGLVSQEIVISDVKEINVILIEQTDSLKPVITVKKPIIYLYATQKTDVSIKLDYKGKIATTFPKYQNGWNVTAYPDGKIFDLKTNRFYASLFWDGDQIFPKSHFDYKTGFVIKKENLTDFLIHKLEFIGLSETETNEFVQFWLPILEKNDYNFIHFWVNDDYDGTCKSFILPKPETSIRVFMDFYGLENYKKFPEQILSNTKRKGFTYVEWGGSDVSSYFINSKNP